MTRGALLLLAGGVAAADLWTKLAIIRRLALGTIRPVVDGWLNIVHFRNPGVAFGLRADLGRAVPWILTGVSAIIAAIVLATALRTPLTERSTQIGLHFVLGGALSNIVNRLTLGPVVDFLDVYVRTARGEYHWPAFNIADSAIAAGIALLLLAGWRSPSAASEVST